MQPGEPFSGLAALYAERRPGYPAAALDYVMADLPASVHVADIGCGTGISSRLLAGRGARVYGIDPNLEMLAQARHQTAVAQPVVYVAGVAERVPLRDACMHLVLSAQSFHWFDTPSALLEFRRILREGGRLAGMWNAYDRDDPVARGYAGIARRARLEAAASGRGVGDPSDGDREVGGLFIERGRRQFSNPQEMDWHALLGRARSASYWPRRGEAQERFERELRELFDAHRVNETVVLRYVTEVILTQPRKGRRG